MTQPAILSRIVTAAALVVLCACLRGGNIVGKERASLRELHAASGANVSIKELQVKILDIKARDGTTHKDLSFSFSAKGEVLQKYYPGFKYVCALPDLALTEGFVFCGNTPVDNKLEPEFQLNSLNDFLRSVKNTEPSTCEIEFRLRERDPTHPAPRTAPPEEKSVGKACYRLAGTKRSLTEGACPAGLVNRKVLSSSSTVSPRLLSARWYRMVSPPDFILDPGVALTVNKVPVSNKLRVRVTLSATCKDEKLESQLLLSPDIAGLEPGETWWSENATFFDTKQLQAAARQCDVTIQVKEEEPIAETAQYCVSGDTFKEGACL